jgi:lipopolysaccharide transport system permease protein
MPLRVLSNSAEADAVDVIKQIDATDDKSLLPFPARHEDGPAESVLVLAPPGARPRVDIRELWAYRSLIFFMVWRDLKVRYAQTVLGAGWAIMQPLLTVVVFTVIFGKFAGVPSDGVPYAVFSLAAVVPWTYFSTSFSTATVSLVNNSVMLTKVYFPRLVLPLSAVIAGLVDFAIAFVIALIVMLAYRITPSPLALVLVPLLVLTLTVTAAGVGCWLAALAIQYRDVKHVAPFLVQIWMYASPIVYPMSIVPAKYRWLYALNPMVGIVEGFRAVLLGTSRVPWGPIGTAMLVAAVLLLSGVRYFRHAEHRFADVA